MERAKKMNSFSVYKAPVQNTIPYKNVSIPDVCKVLKSDKYKYVTDKLRALTSKAERDMCKVSDFDYTTFSGTFIKRANTAIIQHSNYFCVDFDHVGDRQAIAGLKQQIRLYFEPVLMFVSPSGDGLKAVFQIDIAQASHEQYFTAFQNFFRKELHIEIDEKCKDVARACFLPYDPECFYSENPTILDKYFIETFTSEQTEPKRQAVEWITDPDLIIKKLYVWINDKQSFVEGSRNKYVFDLCAAFNRYGINENKALETLLPYAETGFPESGIRATVRSVYSNKALFNTSHFEVTTGQEIKPQAEKEPETLEQTPLMPIEGMPEFIQHLIKECNRVYGTHRDLWAAAFFSATSTALGQSVMLKTQYENTPLFWLTVVGASGVGKSEPFKFAFKRLHELDYTAFGDYQRQYKQYQADKKQMPKGETPPDPPICKQSIVVDATPEAMARAMNAKPRGISIMRDELHGWFEDFGRYSKSGEQQNMLSVWSQQVFKVARVNSETLFIENPFVNVFGGIQPGLLGELAKDNRAINGFLPRFCFVFPDKIETPRFQREELDSSLIVQYQTYIDRLLSIPGTRNEIRLNSEALELYGDFVNKNADINDFGKQPDYLNEVNAKLNIIVLRTALLFHFSNWACTGNNPPEITGTTMKAAVNLTEYFRITAKKVYRIISKEHKSLTNKDVIKYLTSLGHNSQTDIATILGITRQAVSKTLKDKPETG